MSNVKEVAIIGVPDAGIADFCAALTEVSTNKYGGDGVTCSPAWQPISIKVKGPKHTYLMNYDKSGPESKQYDAVIAVVSAVHHMQHDDAEHVRTVQSAGRARIVPFLNKCDLLGGDREQLLRAELSIRGILHECGVAVEQAEIIRGSTKLPLEANPESQDSLVKLFEELEKLMA